MRIHIERESDYIHVTRTLAVAEQSSLYSVSACQNTQLTVCNRTTSVIVRVQGYNEVLSVNQALAHILDLTCIDVRHRHRYRYGQVDNDFLFGGRLPDFDNLVTNISRKLHFRTRKRLGRILEQILSFCLSSIFHTELCSEFCNVYNLFLGLFEYLFTLSVRRRIVEVHNSPLDALQSLKSLCDNMLSRLRKYLYRYVVGYEIFFNQSPDKRIFRLARSGKTYFYLLKSYLTKESEKLQLLLETHRYNQCLVAVSQIDTAPYGSFVDVLFFRPVVALKGRHIISSRVLVKVFHIYLLLKSLSFYLST